ncbi:transposable element Tcb2 transposase [Trichonephila clavipes]|nr:transposable element Tcb2 transposase [Trichonephila clavipes]
MSFSRSIKIDATEQGDNCRCVSEIRNLVGEIVTTTFRPYLTEELRWRVIGRLEAGQTRRNITETPAELRFSLAASPGRLVSRSTVRRRLHECGLYSRRPAICIPLYHSGNIIAHNYRDDILNAYVCPHAGTIGGAFVQQDHNARPHRAHIVDAYLKQETIQRM